MPADSLLPEGHEGRAQDAGERGAVQGCAGGADTVDSLAVSVVL